MAVLLASTAAPFAASGHVDPCTHLPALPAYAHNDYANARPLSEALELGFRGIEADLLLRGGELRVGHDAGHTRAGRSFETLYLRPLRARVQLLDAGVDLIGTQRLAASAVVLRNMKDRRNWR